MKLKLCGCQRNRHENMKRVALHQKIQKKTVDHENVEAKATVEFVVDVQLVLEVVVAKREYDIQRIWHTANGPEMIG